MEQQVEQAPEIIPEKAVILEFEDVAPRWNKLLNHTYDTIDDVGIRTSIEVHQEENGLKLTDPTYCLVGEAHGFNRDYASPSSGNFCKECYHFSMFRAIDAIGSKTKFNEFKANFMRHYNEEHL